MEIMNSKAYYLKNYAIRKRHHTQHHHPQHQTQPISHLKDQQILRIQNINRLPEERPKHNHRAKTNPADSGSSKSSFIQAPTSSAARPKTKDAKLIWQREQSLLSRVIDQKTSELKKRRSFTEDTARHRVRLSGHPLGEVISLQVQIMKPTDRYFHRLENVRMAEKLLLAKPSSESSTRDLKKFYRRQSEYKANITRMSFRNKKENERSRVRMLNRKKWTD